jgi:serine/threonine protein kinase
LPKIAGLDLQELIGRGSCGAVYRAVNVDSGEPCAVKVFSSMAINRKLMGIGMRGLQQMPDHPGILKPLSFAFESSPYYCAMPLIGFPATNARGEKIWDVPTLEECCGETPPEEAWRYIYEVCRSMAWLHRHSLVHCNLKPRNVLLESNRESSTKISDIVQGWVGGVHHFETTDHFMYLSPQQGERPDQIATHGTSWDVYSFGVLAFRLLTGRFPRAGAVFAAQVERQNQVQGVPLRLDNGAILHAVRMQPDVEWPAQPASKWDGRRRQIIEQCLELDTHNRWPDLREVMHEFERVDAEALIEDARGRVDVEKRRQSRKFLVLGSAALVLGTGFIAVSTYGWWYGRDTLQKLRSAEQTSDQKARDLAEQVAARDTRIATLQTKLSEVHEEKRLANANLEMSQQAVDQFLTQLLEIPTGIGLEAEISDKQLNDALAFYDAERARLKDDDDLLPERARNYFNTGQLLLRKRRRDEAAGYLVKARSALQLLLQKQPGHSDTPRRQALLGRSCRWLGAIKAEDGRRGEARDLFKQAVAALTPAVEGDAANRSTRFECASAWYELGKRSRRDGQVPEAVDSLAKVPLIMDAKLVGAELTAHEQFLIARSRVEQGLAQRDLGTADKAMSTLFDAMEELVKLVERGRDKSGAHNEDQALTLAEAYIEFGDLVATKIGGTDARDAHNEAMNILIELVRVHPQWGEARYLMGRNYGALAALERDLGNAAEAQRRQGMAVQALAELAKLYPNNIRYVSELAKQKGQNAQLLCDLGKAKDAIPLAEDAIVALEGVLKKDDAALDVLDRKTCGVLLAQLYGILGHSGEVSKNTKLAKSSFSRASDEWKKLKAAHGSDDIIEQGLTWTTDRLAKIR